MSKLSVKWHLGFMYTHRHTRRHTHREGCPRFGVDLSALQPPKPATTNKRRGPLTLADKRCHMSSLLPYTHTPPPFPAPCLLPLLLPFFVQLNKLTKQQNNCPSTAAHLAPSACGAFNPTVPGQRASHVRNPLPLFLPQPSDGLSFTLKGSAQLGTCPRASSSDS